MASSEEALLSILNPQPQKLPGPSLLHQLVFGSSQSNPAGSTPACNDADRPPALDYRAPDGQRTVLTYDQLHQVARILAAQVCQKLAEIPDSADQKPKASDQQLVVPVLIPQAPELYTSLLAILKLGGAFCPIQLDAPTDRIRFILNDVAASVILTTREMAARLPADRPIRVVLVDELRLFEEKHLSSTTPTFAPTFAPIQSPTPQDLAYVMYTSGSTGTPKGVGVPHIAATQSLLAHDRHVPQFSRFLNFAAPTFDVSVFEIFFPLFRGATLVSVSRAELLNDLPAVIRSMDVDACELTPTVAGSLLRSRANAPNLRLLLTIGEMLTEPVIQEFGDAPGRPSILWGMYGPTEAAIHCTLQPAMGGSSSVKNIGFPLDTVSAYILEIPEDDQKKISGDPRIVPRGEVGELSVGGYQLATGYINRPEQTAAAFIDTEKYGRLYRTGDKARITSDGILECSGRLSGGQVKLRGQRIELGEIEQAILRTSGCLGCVASVINGILVAFCDVGDEKDGMEDKILGSCRSWLPRFMVPGDIVLMTEFPRLASGKIDRKLLTSQYAPTERSSVDSAPTFKDDLDETLHNVASEVLGHNINNSFPLSSAGLDSLKSIQFAALLRSSGIHNASAVDVLESKTLSALHSRLIRSPDIQANTTATTPETGNLDTAKAIAQVPGLQGDAQGDIELVSECTPIQTSMLVETLSNPQAYCNWVELRFSEKHDEEKITSAFNALIEQNEAMRTGFAQYDGRFIQVIWRHARSSQINRVASCSRDFQFSADEDFLLPFQVELQRTSSEAKDQSVHGVIRVHHAVYDGWSMDLIRKDLEAILEQGQAPQRLPYRHVSRHLLSVSSEQTDAAKQYWAQSLNGFQPPALPELQTTGQPASHVLTQHRSITGVDSASVEDLSRKFGCGVQTVFQAALAWIWSTLVASSDVVIGTVASGRTLPLDGIESIIGPCLQTVPLRVDLAQVQSIHDLLNSLQSANRSLLPHAFLPLGEIKKTTGIRPGQPIFDVLFVYQESLYSAKGQQDAVQEIAHQDFLETKLLWEVEPINGGFQVRTSFHNDVFPEAQVSVMLDQFQSIVSHIVKYTESDLASVQSCFSEELLSCHNLNYRTLTGCADLGQLVQQVANEDPDRPAVRFATSFENDQVVSESISFQDLNRLANQIARHLKASGAHVDDAVAIVMQKSVLLYAGILGILKAGCTYVPLLPNTPAARTSQIFEQAGVQLCVTDTHTAENLVSRLPVKLIDLQTAKLGGQSNLNLDGIPLNPDRAAYIIFTSGSTGVPKGVCVTQLNICSNLDVLSRLYPHTKDDRLLQSCSQAFDVSVFEIFFTWKCGMCLCSATNDILFDDLERAIRLLGVTHLSMTPTVAALVDPQNAPSVQFLVTSGEAMTERVARMWVKQLFQGYGPSETTNICTVRKMAHGDAIRHLGYEFENTSSLVLYLDSLNTVPLGAVGELCFGGDQVAAGYLKMPELTGQKFIQHPKYGRIYRSGDIGRMLPDGSLMITGRVDEQIKLRGQRIELNEINSMLRESGLLSEFVTLVVHNKSTNSKQLAAFIVPSELPVSSSTASLFHLLDARISPYSDLVAKLFDLLKSRLPVYMVPTYLIPASALPFTPSGKVNRSLLHGQFESLTPDQLVSTTDSASQDESGDNSEWTDLEKKVAAIVARALGADSQQSLGRWTPLASLGLDSISAIRVSKYIRQDLHHHLAISDILKNTSVARLAKLLETTGSDGQSHVRYDLDVFSAKFLADLQEELDARQIPFEKVLPCTPLQEAMLVSPVRGKSYVNSMLFKINGDVEKLRSAWEQICDRQPILRTCFVTSDNAQHPIAQVVLEQASLPWLELGTMANGEIASPASIDSLVDTHFKSLSEPIDSYVPPVSFAIISLFESSYLSFVCHHAVYDGEAMGRLLYEVEQLVQGNASIPQPPPFSAFLELALALPDSTDDFWAAHLSDFRPTFLAPTQPDLQGKNQVLAKTLDLSLSQLQSGSKDLGFSLLTVFQSAWASSLKLLSGTDDICFGNVYNGRSVPLDGIDELVAPCFNTLPVRAKLSDMQSNKELLSYFQTINPTIMQYQFTPLRQIQRKHLGSSRLFDSLLLLQKPSQSLDSSVWTLERDDGEMDFPLVCEISPDDVNDRVNLRLHYDSSFVSDDTATFISDLFESLANSLIFLSSSRIPSQKDIAPAMQKRFTISGLRFTSPAVDESESVPADSAVTTAEEWNMPELAIRSVLARLSGAHENSISRDTTIYRLGLDSVRAVQVAALLRKEGLSVSAVDVMEYPTCKSLGHFLSRSTSEPTLSTTSSSVKLPSSGYTSIAPSSPVMPAVIDFATFKSIAKSSLDKAGILDKQIEAILPCTPLQAGLLTEFTRSLGQHYFNFVTFEVTAKESQELDAEVLVKAWETAVSLVPMLRTGFVPLDDDAPDSESPFAMIHYKASVAIDDSTQILFVPKSHQSLFHLDIWQQDATKYAIGNLEKPPWQVAVQETDRDNTILCHLAIHHALYDATSLQMILDTVSRCILGDQSTLKEKVPPIETVVSDILHQTALSASSSSELAKSWKSLAQKAVINRFPVLTPLKVEKQTFRVASHPSSQSLNALADAVQKSGFTIYAVLAAAWTRILSSYLGDPGVVFGSVLSGRNSAVTSNAVFPCLSTLPVVAENSPSNRTLVEQMMGLNLLLHKSQHIPTSQIQRWLGQAESRLFDTLLVYQKTDTENDDFEPVPHSWTITDEKAIVDYPVSIEAIPGPNDRLTYQITYDDSVLPGEQVSLLLSQLDAIVNNLAFNPDGYEDDLVPVVPELHSALPPEHRELPSDITLMHQFVERQAERIPNKTALQFVTAFDKSGNPVSQEWTFAELNQRGDAVCSLVSRYAEPGSIVGVCFDKCPEAFFGILGILKAGCSFVALDPSAPPARKEFILLDSKAALLVTDAPRANAPSSETGLFDNENIVPIIGIKEQELASQIVPQTVSGQRRPALPSDNCYCLYTSGTTGTPKGCAITHENAVQGMLAFQELFKNHWDEDSRWLQFASFHFDVSVLEQYWTWSMGLVLVGAPRDLILEDLAGTISRLKITHIDLTPSLGRLLDPKDVPSLCRGVFITGGEPLKAEMLDPWGPTGAVHNFYGPTEATIGVTSYPQVPQNGRASNIGRQFPNVGSFVFRPGTQTPVLKGAVGELCVSGKLVGKGYLNRDDLTNDRFPTLQEKSYPGYGERIYRTGDLVRLLHDGCFDFLGRADDQVKLRGQRLEIGEINHAILLGAASTVGDVATLVIRDEANSKDFLVSFVVATEDLGTKDRNAATLLPISNDNAATISRQVQSACRERLPAYMVPTYVVQLPFIPLSANNKAEAKELKRLFNSLTPEERMKTTGAGGTNGHNESLSINPAGKTLVSVLKRLGFLDPNSDISTSTSLFELGVDSISVLRVARALKREGLPATPSLLLSHPVVGDLVVSLGSQKSQSDIGSVLEARLLVDACQHRNRSHVCRSLGVDPSEIEYIAPCSALQQGMISRSRSGPEHRDTYFNSFTFHIAPDTSVEKLKGAWEAVIARHSIFRTRFVATVDGFLQVALKSPATVPWIQLGPCQSLDLDQHQKEWVDTNQDDIIGTPIRILSVVCRDRNFIILQVFHGLYDATSLDLLLGQVVTEYFGKATADDTAVPTFLEALIHGPLKPYGGSRPFWEQHLNGHIFRPLPSLSSASPHPWATTARRSVSFSAADKLRATLGVTHGALVQAVWISVLQKILGGPASLGLVLSGRTMEDLDNTEAVIGPLFNTLPFYVPRRAGETWASLAQFCHNFNTTTLPFQQAPLRDIQKWCSSGQPLFDVLFSFQLDEAIYDTGSMWIPEPPQTHADYPLALEATLAGTSLELLLVARPETANEDTLSQVLDNFAKGMQSMADNVQVLVYAEAEQNGIATGASPASIANGVSSSGMSSDALAHNSSFVWDGDAITLRREISLLSSVPETDIHENTTLLELGLDSVDTIKLSARLRTSGIELKNSQLVRGQSISAFLKIISEDSEQNRQNGDARMNGSDANGSDISTVSALLKEYLLRNGRDLSAIEEVLPPTPLQEAMVADMIQSDFTRYFNHDIFALATNVDLESFKKAWIEVVAKSPVLRTVFFSIDSPDFDFAYCQAVNRDVDASELISQHDIDSRDELSKLVDTSTAQARQSQGEVGLIHLAFARIVPEDRWYLVFSISHALYDGWSLELIHRNVEAEYQKTISSGTASVVVARPDASSNAAYIKQLGNILQSSGPQADSFWRSFLADAHPTYIPKQADALASKSVIRTEVSSSVTPTDLVSFCKSQATSMQVVGQACWAAVLAGLTGSLDVIFGVVLSGRDTDGAEEAMFPTMNTVPVRVVLHGTVPELLQYMQANMGSIGEYQHYPLRKSQKVVKRTATNEGGIFNTLFILQKRIEGQGDEVSTPAMQSIEGVSNVEYPICIELEVIKNSGKDTLVWRTACDSAYVQAGDVSQLLQQLDATLQFFIQSSDPELGKTGVLSFREGGVSVCGLPTFMPRLQHPEPQKEPVSDTNESWSEVEETIRSVLSAVSGIPEDSIQRIGQTVYHMGLDSISTIKVSSILKKTKGIALGVRAILSASSIEEMASLASTSNDNNLVENGIAADSDALTSALATVQTDKLLAEADIAQEQVDQVLPATAMQVHMISVWQNSAGGVFFPEFHYKLSNVAGGRHTIFAAWKALIAEFPILRTVLIATSSQTVPLLQVVLKPSDSVTTVDDEWWPAAGAIANAFAILSVEPGENGAFALTLKIHHALYDAVSLSVILDRFRELCAMQVSQLPDKQEVIPVSSSWTQAVARQLPETTKQHHRDFWTSYFGGAKAAKTKPTTDASIHPSRVSLFLPGALPDVAALRTVAAKHGLGLQSLLFAAYAKTLSSGTSEEDVVFGIYLANREEGSQDDLTSYPTLCLVPLLVKTPGQQPLVDIALQIQADIHMISSSGVNTAGLWEIVEWAGIAVGSFVNFLLPDSDVNSATEVALEAVEKGGAASWAAIPEDYKALQGNKVRSAYQDAVDVELAVRDDHLDIGVFGSSVRLGETGAADIISGLLGILHNSSGMEK